MNAVVPNTSPAFSFNKEHLSGPEYAHYLSLVAKNDNLPIQTNTQVLTIQRHPKGYHLNTSQGDFSCRYLIMATGEFQLPNNQGIKGAELGMHYGQVDSFNVKSEDPFIIIGGNESACDALTHLAYLGNETDYPRETQTYSRQPQLSHSHHRRKTCPRNPSNRKRLSSHFSRWQYCL